jgi:hypothetical protein
VASYCRIAQPYWKPCVHSVQPWLVYRPLTVNTGDPLAGSHEAHRFVIFAPETGQKAASGVRRSSSVTAVSMRTGSPLSLVIGDLVASAS